MLTHTHAVYTYILLFSQLAHTRKRTHLIELHMSECTENTYFVTLTPKHKLLDFFFFFFHRRVKNTFSFSLSGR